MSDTAVARGKGLLLDVGHHERKMGRGAAVHHRHIRKKAILPGNR